jgi:NAD(P)-dependent dehydrogenase (short-subunit alcohol dehydrogenase family)
VHFVEADLASGSALGGAVLEVEAAIGPVDILVNNAAIWHRHTYTDISSTEWDRVMAVNLRAPFLLIQRLAPGMAERGSGVVVNVASQAGLSYTRGQGAHYHAAKAGLVHLTKVLAFELGPQGVRINCVAPGATRSADASGAPQVPRPDQPALEAILAQIPLGRSAVPDEIAATCLFLASDRASYVTGQTLLVNGGAIGFT